MEAGSIRQRSKSACFPGSVSVAEEFRAFGFSVRRAVPGIVGSIAPVPKLSGSSTAVRPAASLAIARTLLSGQRTRGQRFVGLSLIGINSVPFSEQLVQIHR